MVVTIASSSVALRWMCSNQPTESCHHDKSIVVMSTRVEILMTPGLHLKLRLCVAFLSGRIRPQVTHALDYQLESRMCLAAVEN